MVPGNIHISFICILKRHFVRDLLGQKVIWRSFEGHFDRSHLQHFPSPFFSRWTVPPFSSIIFLIMIPAARTKGFAEVSDVAQRDQLQRPGLRTDRALAWRPGIAAGHAEVGTTGWDQCLGCLGWVGMGWVGCGELCLWSLVWISVVSMKMIRRD